MKFYEDLDRENGKSNVVRLAKQLVNKKRYYGGKLCEGQ